MLQKIPFFIIGIIFISGFLINPAAAHELLPTGVIEYVQNHPSASPEEVEQFFATEYPELYVGYSSEGSILSAAQNKDAKFFSVSRDFLVLGFKHILGGWDHLLFILAWLLVITSVRQIFVLISAFTVAHSITLILAAANILIVPSSVVEPIIALSIAVLALGSVFFPAFESGFQGRAKVSVVFIFGLVHGLGFAGLLQDINIIPSNFINALVSFNVGIELGQILVVAMVLPVLYLLKKSSWQPTVIKLISITISALAFGWFLQRIGLL